MPWRRQPAGANDQQRLRIRLRQPQQSDLIQRKLFTVHMHVYAAPSYINRYGEPQSIEDLDNHKIISFGEPAPNYLLDVNWLETAGRSSDNPRQPHLQINSLTSIKRACLLGIGIAMLPFIWNVFVSLRNGKIAGDDPWEGNTLEWATSSPPPFYNFAVIPTADKIDAFHEAKKNGVELMPAPEHYEPIHMPKNTGNGLIVSAFVIAFGFAMIWHIWWLAIVGLVGAVVSFIVRSYDEDIDYYVQPEEIARIEQAHHQTKANAVVQA